MSKTTDTMTGDHLILINAAKQITANTGRKNMSVQELAKFTNFDEEKTRRLAKELAEIQPNNFIYQTNSKNK